MRTFTALLAAAACGMFACAHDYNPPSRREPHASIETRLSYHAWPGPLLEQTLTIDGADVQNLPQPTPQGPGGKAAHTILVRPGRLSCLVQATFFHNDVSTHAETYETSEAAPCGSETCTQVRPHTRLVSRAARTDDATCSQGTRIDAKAGKHYVIEFDFQADGRCTLRCLRKVGKPRGESANVSCEDSPPARDRP